MISDSKLFGKARGKPSPITQAHNVPTVPGA